MAQKPITEALGYLMFQICRAHRNKAQELLSELGLYTGQEILLMHLWLEDGLTQTALAERLCIQRATLTKTLDRLEQAGLVARRPDDEDRRVTRVHITDKGQELRRSIERVWREVEAQSFGNLSLEEHNTLRRLLEKAYANLA